MTSQNDIKITLLWKLKIYTVDCLSARFFKFFTVSFGGIIVATTTTGVNILNETYGHMDMYFLLYVSILKSVLGVGCPPHKDSYSQQ